MKQHRTISLDEAGRLVGDDVRSVVPVHGASGSGVFEVETVGGSVVVVKLFEPEQAWKLAKELSSSRLLAERRVDLPVPRILATHSEEHALVLERLEGVPAGEVDDADAPELYRELGRLLARLHTIELDGFGYLTADGILEPHATNLDYMRSQFRTRLREFVELGGDARLGSAIAEHVRVREQLLAGPAAPVFCHNDCHEGNVVVSLVDGVKVTGWFDFENALAGDPLLDLAKTVAYSGRNRSVVTDALADGYGELPPDWREAVDLYGLFHVLELWTWFASLGEREPLDDLARSLVERIS